ncbi:MAG: NUDIX domain-containing protein [Patescibacteria group bacterium]
MENSIEVKTSAGGVVVNKNGEVLVVNQNGNSWSLPKGHIEDGEEVLTAAKREIYEESGISELELVRELGKYRRTAIDKDGKGEIVSIMKEIIIFYFKTKQMDLKPIDKDNPEAKWVSKDEVSSILTHPKDKEFFLSIKNQI